MVQSNREMDSERAEEAEKDAEGAEEEGREATDFAPKPI